MYIYACCSNLLKFQVYTVVLLLGWMFELALSSYIIQIFFRLSLMLQTNKLECWSLTKHFQSIPISALKVRLKKTCQRQTL